MALELKLRKIGNSVGVVLPKEALTETPDGFRVTSKNPNFAEKMKVAEALSRRYRNALDELAK